jgi:hypothetical protein
MAPRALSLLALAAVLAVLAAPAAALAQSGGAGPSSPGLGAPEPEETAPAPVTTDDPADDGLETWQQVLIFAAGIVLLGGIAAAIMSDARRNAPVRDRGRGERRAGGDGAADEALHRHRQAGKQRARRKGRAARAARRRNR